MRAFLLLIIGIIFNLNTMAARAIDGPPRPNDGGAEISKLIAAIKAEPSVDTRIDLVTRLGDYFTKEGAERFDQRQINAMIGLLEDKSTSVQFRIALMLGRIGKRAEGAIPALKEIFRKNECAFGTQTVADAAYEALRRLRVMPMVTQRCSRYWAPPRECVLSFHMDWSGVSGDLEGAQRGLKLPNGRPWLESLDSMIMDGSRLHLDFKENCDQKEDVFEKLLAYWRANKIALPKFERFEERVPDYSP